MGKKIKTEIDWSQDKGNQKGDVIILAQHAQTGMGLVSFLGQAPTYDYYGDLVNEAFENSHLLHERVLELPISKGSNMRHLLDDDLLKSIYSHGSQLVTNLYLMFEHLALYAGITAFRLSYPDFFEKFENMELKDKIKALLEEFGAQELLKSKGYGALFADIKKSRDAINHPKGSTIYTIDSTRWDDIPIAWFVSGKHLEACSKAMSLYNDFFALYVEYSDTHKIAGTISLDGPIVNLGYVAPKNKKVV